MDQAESDDEETTEPGPDFGEYADSINVCARLVRLQLHQYQGTD
jgi:hypothetical protein